MILNRLLGKLNFNWKYALGEVVLIFIGITLSLAFDEWRTTRANKTREFELLVELKEAIKRDTSRISTQMRYCQELIRTTGYLKENLAQSKTITDSLSYSLAWLNTSAGFHADYSAYQSLLAAGIINISDSKLRRSIIGYYNECDRLRDWNNGLYKRRDDFIEPLLMHEFDEFNREQSVKLVDFNRFKSNHELHFYIKKSNELYRVTLEGLQSHKSYAAALLVDLPGQ